jgi:hypothetical protein
VAVVAEKRNRRPVHQLHYVGSLNMKENEWRSSWHAVTGDIAFHLTTVTASPGVVYSFDVANLPSALRNLPGLREAYISGRITSATSPEGIAVVGEVAAIRADEYINKSYVWLIGVSGSVVYYNGPYKHFDGHHFSENEAVPVGKIFGNIQIPRSEDEGA